MSIVLTLGLAVMAQGQEPERMQQYRVVIAARTVMAVYLKTDKGLLEYVRCPKPIQWRTHDELNRGWACFEKSTGVYLLNALPPVDGMGSGDIQGRVAPKGSGYDKVPEGMKPEVRREFEIQGSKENEPKYDFPPAQKSGCQNQPRCLGTPNLSTGGVRQPEPPLLRAVKVGASKTDEALQTYRLYKRGGLGAAIPCRTELEKIIPAVITHTCGGIIR